MAHHAIETCVVLVVSGPQALTDQLGNIDALATSWLPGSESAGVADVLFGHRPFTPGGCR
jgi:beta-glucosidase